jgi:drug/metabolite transporter (DMT)-like permease
MLKNSYIKAIIIMLISAFGFSCKNAFGKGLSGTLSLSQIVFFSGLIPMITTSIILLRGEKEKRKTKKPVLQIIRGLSIAATQFSVYLALSKTSIANVTVILFSSTIIASALAIFMLKERANKNNIIAIIIGFLGTFIIINPTSSIFSPYSLIALLASILYAFSIVLGRYIQRTDGVNITVFFYFLMPFLISIVPSIDSNLLHLSISTWLCIAGLSLSCYLGLYAITLSIKLAPIAIVTPINYSQLIFASLIGFFIFQENITTEIYIGAPMIIGSGIYIALSSQKQK